MEPIECSSSDQEDKTRTGRIDAGTGKAERGWAPGVQKGGASVVKIEMAETMTTTIGWKSSLYDASQTSVGSQSSLRWLSG